MGIGLQNSGYLQTGVGTIAFIGESGERTVVLRVMKVFRGAGQVET